MNIARCSALLWTTSLLQLTPNGGTAPRAEDGTGDEVRVEYDLRPLLPTFDREGSWSQALAPSLAEFGGELPHVALQELHQGEPADSITQLVSEALGEDLHYEGRGIQIEGGDRMVVVAPPPVQAKVRQILDLLQSTLGSSVTLELDWLAFTEITPLDRCVVSADEAKRFVDVALTRGATRQHQVLQLAPGRTEAVERVRHIPFLFDYDVEIAQGSFIYDPIVPEVRAGLRALVRGTSLPGGTALSLVWLQEDLIGDVRERPVALKGAVGRETRGGLELVEGPQSMQTADVATHALAFDTFLPDGKGLIAWCDVDVKGVVSRQALVVRRSAGAQVPFAKLALPGGGRSLFVLDTELFGTPRLAISSSNAVDPEWPHPFVLAELRSEPPGSLQDQLGRLNQWWSVGPWAVALTDSSWDASAAADIEKLAGGSRPAPELVELAVDFQGPNGTSPVRWRLPTLAGHSVGAIAGVTGLVLEDYDVEVAQYAAVSDPRMRPTFHGLCLAAEVVRTPANTAWVVRAKGVASFLGAVPTIGPEGPFLGALELPREERLAIDEHVQVAVGQGETVHRIGPGAGDGEQGLGVIVRIK